MGCGALLLASCLSAIALDAAASLARRTSASAVRVPFTREIVCRALALSASFLSKPPIVGGTVTSATSDIFDINDIFDTNVTTVTSATSATIATSVIPA